MKECEPWRSQSEVDFENSLDCMEKLVMNVSSTPFLSFGPFVFVELTFLLLSFVSAASLPLVRIMLSGLTPLKFKLTFRYVRFFSRSTFTPQIALINPSSPITTDDLERDAVLRQRIRLFGWVEGKHLDVIDHDPEEEEPVVEERETKEEGEEGAEDVESKEGGEVVAASRRGGSGKSRDEDGGGVKGFLEFAGSELLKVNHYKVSPSFERVSSFRVMELIISLVRYLQAPRDKLICILNCCKVIFGAQSFFPSVFSSLEC